MGFDAVFDYTIPYLHPLAVHFPVVLLLLAAGVTGVYLVKGSAVWRRASMVFLGMGVAAAIWARETGDALKESMEGTPIVEELVAYHEGMAKLTVYSGGASFLILLAFSFWWAHRTAPINNLEAPRLEPMWFRVLLFLLVTFIAGAVAYTAHIGGVMVWGVPID